MANKIAFILPYFGRFPNSFQLWLNTCASNKFFDWIIFTDNKSLYNYPSNVIVKITSFEDFKSLLQCHFDFTINIPTPYKLCDYRPAYGDIFQEFLVGYDYWGYCDVDLFWGDLEKWINDDTLIGIERVSWWGHCSLLKNTKRINTLYKESIDGILDYKKVFTSDCNYLYDEEGGGQKIFEHFNIPTLKIPFYDVKADCKRFKFTCASEMFVKDLGKDAIFYVNEGRVFLISNENGNLNTKEFAYVHFAKRTFKIEIEDTTNNYIIIPNKIIAVDDIYKIRLNRYQPLFDFYPQYKWKGIKGKIDILLGKNKVKWPNSRLQKISDFLHNK